MGCSPFSVRCLTNTNNTNAIAPNPSPENCELLEKHCTQNGYVLKVKYYGCTNFEGIKILVYRGYYIERAYLDPHFTNNARSPVARFKPTNEGMRMALNLANTF